MTAPTYRQMNMRMFRREPNPHILFQPRFEPWYVWHQQFDIIPDSLKGKSLLELFEDVDCSQRYFSYATDNPWPVVCDYTDEVRIDVNETPKHRTTVYHTPHGDLTEVEEFTDDRMWRTVEFLGKSTEDLDALEWLLARRTVRLDLDHLQRGVDYLGERGEAQFFLPKSPYYSLALQFMRFEAFIYALADEPAKMEQIMEVIDRSYDPFYEQVTASPARIVNFGENIAEAHTSSQYFEAYALPWYHQRVEQLREAGIFSHIHIDGFFKHLIPQIRQLPHDALEALTPLPQGDVTLDEVEEVLNGKVLLDGIPAVLFLEHHSVDELQQCVEQLCDRLGDRLILGISDELPQAATEEGYRRMKWVSQYARNHKLPMPTGT